jgi:hypothetical protein
MRDGERCGGGFGPGFQHEFPRYLSSLALSLDALTPREHSWQ